MSVQEAKYHKLTLEKVPEARSRDIVVTVVGFLLVLLAANAFAGYYLDRYTLNRGSWILGEKWRLLEGLEEPVDWLVLGDSSGNQGLEPELFGQRVGGKAINLCTMGPLTPLSQAWLLEEYIDRHGPPPHVLVINTYDSWLMEISAILVGKIPKPYGFYAKYSGQPAFDLPERALYFLGRYVPLYSDNDTLGQVIRTPSSWFRSPFALSEGGFMPVETGDPQNVLADMEKHLAFLKSPRADLARSSKTALDSLRRTADRHGIDVHLVFGPYYEGLAAAPEYQAQRALVLDRLKEYTAGSGHIHIVEDLVVFPKERMENVDHVLTDAAMIYTDRVAELVRQ